MTTNLAKDLRGTCPGTSRGLAPWYLIEWLNAFGINIFLYCAFYYATNTLKAPGDKRLWISVGWGAVYTICALFSGKMTQRFGPRRVIQSGSVMSLGVSLLSLWLLSHWHFAGLAIAMMLMSWTSNMIWPALESAITRTPNARDLSTRMSWYNLGWASGVFAAFLVADLVMSLGWQASFLAAAGCFALASLVSLVTPRDLTEGHHHEPVSPQEAQRSTQLLHMAWLVNALVHIAVSVLIPITPSLTSVAAIGSIWTFARLIGFIICWKWTGWHYKASWMIGAFVALAGSFTLMLAIQQLWVLVITQVIMGLSLSLIYSSSLYYAMHQGSGSSDNAGMHEALIGAGFFAGPLIGALAGIGSLSVINASVSSALGLGLISLLWMAGKQARR